MWTCQWGLFAYKEGKFGFTSKITLILAFNWQPVEQPWDQHQPHLPMIFYPYTEQKELLKPAAVVMQLHQMHTKFCLAQFICECERIPRLVHSNKDTLGLTSVGWKIFAVKAVSPSPLSLHLECYLFTHLFRTHFPGATPCLWHKFPLSFREWKSRSG